MHTVTFEVNEDGDLEGLYTDDIDLFSIGRVIDVKKASNVEFNESRQVWQVFSMSGRILYENRSRDVAIEWEIKTFSPGGKNYRRS